MSELERAIFSAAYVDALRNIHEGAPMPERVKFSEDEANYVVEMFRKHRKYT